MVRNKCYRDVDILAKAMGVFRRHGYHGVSIKDLERATGLTCGSLYHAFGDKDGLFRAALDHYNTVVVQHRIETYLVGSPGIDGLEKLFASLLHEPDGRRDGCLLTNSAIEFGSGRSVAAAGVRHGLELLRLGFVQNLKNACDQGDLPSDADVDSIALRLLVLYQGLLVLIRSTADIGHVQDLITLEFQQLKGKKYVI